MTHKLLEPRYKVLADYPGSPFKVGEILKLNDSIHPTYAHFTNGEKGIMVDEIDNYPHLFRLLKWWEERDVKDMPEYVSGLNLHSRFMVLKVEWRHTTYLQIRNVEYSEWHAFSLYKNILTPATQQEYEAYQSSKK